MVLLYKYKNNIIYEIDNNFYNFLNNKKIKVKKNKIMFWKNSTILMNELEDKFLQDISVFHSILQNKSIVIVGPSPYLEGKRQGNYIDSFDFVVRMNKGYHLTKNKLDYGSRTDILYHTINQHPENGGELNDTLLKKCNITYVIGAYPILDYDENTSFDNIGTIRDYFTLTIDPNKFFKIDKKRYIEFEKELETRPNTGTICIWDILHSNAKKIYITGFSLFKGGYSNLYRDKIDGSSNLESAVLHRIKKNHNQEKIKKYYKENLLHNNIVKLDDELKNILKE